jgi:uncharacterized protein (DUF849 family)
MLRRSREEAVMRKTDKTIITCAITGAVHLPCMSPHLPITPEQIVDEAVAAAEAGAAMIHLHARDPATGMPTTDVEVYRQFLPKIKARCNAIINITTGQPAVHAKTPEEVFQARLAAPKEFAPEVCSFNLGPLNVGLWALNDKYGSRATHDWERMFLTQTKGMTVINSFEMMERFARELGEERGVRFEFECFDIGHLHTLRFILDRGWVKPPLFIQSCYGFLGALQCNPKHVLHMHQTAEDLFGDQYSWSNLAAGSHQMSMVTMGAILGGHVRVGLEDSLWYGKGQLAVSNADQVRRIRRILEELSRPIATPDEARAILHTKGPDKVNF